MRPVGEVREAVVYAVSASGSTLNEVVVRAGVSYGAARAALQNACRGGQLQIVETRREGHSKRPVAVYKPADVLDELSGGDWRHAVDAVSSWR